MLLKFWYPAASGLFPENSPYSYSCSVGNPPGASLLFCGHQPVSHCCDEELAAACLFLFRHRGFFKPDVNLDIMLGFFFGAQSTDAGAADELAFETGSQVLPTT